MANLENTTRDHARPSKDALNSEEHGPDTPTRRMEKLANESAQRSSDRIKKGEVGKGVISKSDGH